MNDLVPEKPKRTVIAVRRLASLVVCGVSCVLAVSCALKPESENEAPPAAYDAAAARALIGQEVTIEDVVKGVSQSPRSGTVYLSFGDAYPRQNLSVKIPAENTDALESPYFGRRVRVSGLVQSSKDGPLIVLTDASRLLILKSVGGDVLNETGEGPAYYWRVRVVVDDLMRAKDYAGLEALARKWRAGRVRMSDGQWLLPHFYGTITWIAKEDPAMDPGFAGLAAWREARPRAIEPVIAEAMMWVRYAWAARGGGYADTVTPEGWDLFAERLEKARQILDGLGPRFAECPEAARVMQRVALGQGWTDDAYEKLYRTAIAREPEYLDYYVAKAYRLLPRWSGEPGEWEAYARTAAEGNFGRELLARIAWEQRDFYWNVLNESTLTWAEVNEGFMELKKRYPASSSIRSVHALFAGLADDRAACLRLLDEAGDTLDMRVWINWENVAFARRWATDPGGPPPVIFRLVERREKPSVAAVAWPAAEQPAQ